jgi:hypothetical protein
MSRETCGPKKQIHNTGNSILDYSNRAKRELVYLCISLGALRLELSRGQVHGCRLHGIAQKLRHNPIMQLS